MLLSLASREAKWCSLLYSVFMIRFRPTTEGQMPLDLCTACPQDIDLSGSAGGVRHYTMGASRAFLIVCQ